MSRDVAPDAAVARAPQVSVFPITRACQSLNLASLRGDADAFTEPGVKSAVSDSRHQMSRGDASVAVLRDERLFRGCLQ